MVKTSLVIIGAFIIQSIYIFTNKDLPFPVWIWFILFAFMGVEEKLADILKEVRKDGQ